MKKPTTTDTTPSKLALPEWTRPDLTLQALRRGIKPGTLHELGRL